MTPCLCPHCLPGIRAVTATGVIYIRMSYDAWSKSHADEAVVDRRLATDGQCRQARTAKGRAQLLYDASVDAAIGLRHEDGRDEYGGGW